MSFVISEDNFSQISLYVLLTGLILFMGFIIWDLGKKSNAGKWGMLVLFVVLGLGVSGFLFKNFVVETYIINRLSSANF